MQYFELSLPIMETPRDSDQPSHDVRTLNNQSTRKAKVCPFRGFSRGHPPRDLEPNITSPLCCRGTSMS